MNCFPFACKLFVPALWIFFTCFVLPVQAQEEKIPEKAVADNSDGGASINFGADLVSRYVWRGIDLGNSPAIQPNLSFSWKGFEIGAWGSYAFASHQTRVNDTLVADAGTYAETDLYLSYSYKWFTLMVFDYFTVNGLDPNNGNRYFDFNKATTGHAFEGSLSFEGPEKFPLQATIGTLFYGADKGKDLMGHYGEGTDNNYSTYIELGWKFQLKFLKTELKPFFGGIPYGSSWYGPYAGITNLGVTARKDIPFTAQYSLPVRVSIISNPQAQSVFFTFGITL